MKHALLLVSLGLLVGCGSAPDVVWNDDWALEVGGLAHDGAAALERYPPPRSRGVATSGESVARDGWSIEVERGGVTLNHHVRAALAARAKRAVAAARSVATRTFSVSESGQYRVEIEFAPDLVEQPSTAARIGWKVELSDVDRTMEVQDAAWGQGTLAYPETGRAFAALVDEPPTEGGPTGAHRVDLLAGVTYHVRVALRTAAVALEPTTPEAVAAWLEAFPEHAASSTVAASDGGVTRPTPGAQASPQLVVSIRPVD